MRILFTSTTGLGHLLPTLTVASIAAGAGHAVAVATDAAHADRVQGSGLRHVPTAQPAAAMRDAIASDPMSAPLAMFGRLRPLAALPAVLGEVASFRPDLIASEAAEYAGGMAAERTGVPWIRISPSAVHGDVWDRIGADVLNETRAEVGLPVVSPETWPIPVPQLCRFPLEFEESARTEGVVRWRPGQERPIVALSDRADTAYITLGTEAQALPFFGAVLRACVAAVHSAGLRPLVAVHDADPSTWAGIDADVRPWVDQAEVIPPARVVICHGGAGTVLDALTAATPIVAVPFFADQPANAERLETTGTGIAVPPGPGLAERLAAGLRDVVDEGLPGTMRMAQALRGLPGPEAVLGLIDDRARTGRTEREPATGALG